MSEVASMRVRLTAIPVGVTYSVLLEGLSSLGQPNGWQQELDGIIAASPKDAVEQVLAAIRNHWPASVEPIIEERESAGESDEPADS